MHQALIERCRGVLSAEKDNINKPLYTALHARYKINEEFVESVRCAVPGRVVVSNADPLQSVAEGKGLREAEAGNETQFVITTKDSNGKQCYDENDQVIVKVETPSGEELKHTITNENSGQYNVSFTPDCVGQHNVVIEINGQPLTGSPWRVYVLHRRLHRYKRLFSFGSFKKVQGQFFEPIDIAINDTTGNIAVAVLIGCNHLVQKGNILKQ